MKTYIQAIVLIILSFLLYNCEKEDRHDENQTPGNGYFKLKQSAKSDPSVFFQDFTESQLVTQVASDQWKVGSTVWWVIPWNSMPEPVFQDSCMVLTSTKSSIKQTTTKNEVQTIEDFQIGNSGEFIVGYKSTRWKYGFDRDDHWVDSNIGLELYGDVHKAIVFTYGSMGVFADPTGFCPDNTCMYSKASGWPGISASGDFLGVRITWQTETDHSRTFKLYFNEESVPQAELRGVNYDFGRLRIRLNANVTDADKLPAEDADTLLIDYISLKNHLMVN